MMVAGLKRSQKPLKPAQQPRSCQVESNVGGVSIHLNIS
ncbi:hypothetical protein Pint_09729 [Pistacia integerrima]|uniref:Uncharacterized protein n=1 Tax=Pistacia integerrima TaxID=434235 RepID=A0ACC0XJN5_9ROSI|nr:hypothetical protein Pint_09729 [Pistacia integerrima]